MRPYSILVLFAMTILGDSFAQQGSSEYKQIFMTKIPKPSAPASLVISNIGFYDNPGNNNSLLDANESAKITFIIKNEGRGDAYNCSLGIAVAEKIKGLIFSPSQAIGNIKSGESRNITIPIEGTNQLESGTANFKINITEGNGFHAEPFNITITTQKFLNPQIVITDYNFSSENAGKIKLGQIINLYLIIQNRGQGKGSNITMSFKTPLNVFPVNKSEYNIGELVPNESRTINYEFFTNKQYSGTEIPIIITTTESYNKYGEERTLKVSLEQNLQKTNNVIIAGIPLAQTSITEMSLLSEVDKNIPKNSTENKNCFALIIGNEDYSRFQSDINTEVNVFYARNDATVFKEYVINTLGVSSTNVFMILDATAGEMNQKLDLICKLALKSGKESELLFYYAGHGLPDEVTKTPYLIPVDVNGTNLTSALRLSDVYRKLSETNAKRITIFLDACFSGGGREAGLLAARSVKVKPLNEVLAGNMVAFSASSMEQSALPYNKEKHGIFTYFLLKKIQETSGNITYGDLANYLSKTVSIESLKVNQKEQDPSVNVSTDVKDVWESWKLR